MLSVTPEYVRLAHIMWQPTNKCLGKCRGCYVKESTSADYNGPVKTDLIDLIYQSGKLECSQLTISLDMMHPSQIPQNLIDALKVVWQQASEGKGPDLCVTLHNLESLVMWTKALGFTPQEFLAPLDMLSLSSFPVERAQCRSLKSACATLEVTLNYNHVIKCDVEEDRNLEQGCEFADMIYLVLHKRPLGESQDLDMIDYWLDALKLIPDSAMGEVSPDTCIQDAIRFKETGLKCSAGIGKIQVWPDGSVTGCPYDSKRVVTPTHEEGYDTWQQIQEVLSWRESHPMNFCTIAQGLQDIKDEMKTVAK